jgi:hypothetical protein
MDNLTRVMIIGGVIALILGIALLGGGVWVIYKLLIFFGVI